MRIGIVTDEIADDIQDAIQTGLSWGIKDYELRVIAGKRVPDISEETVQWLLQQKEQAGIRITAVSPGIFKTPLAEQEILREELQSTLPASLQLAKTLGTSLVIVFGFRREPDEPEDNRELMMDIFRQAANLARKDGMTIAVENEPGFWCDTGSNTAAILNALNLPNLRANWDPANAFGMAEPPFPEGYYSIRPYIANLHIKDTPENAHVRCVPVGEGRIDWEGQLRAVVKDGILDLVTIETHCLPLKENSLRNLQQVREMIARAKHS